MGVGELENGSQIDSELEDECALGESEAVMAALDKAIDSGTELSVYQYNISMDEWTRLCDHCLESFGMCEFQGKLTTVGGKTNNKPSNKVYCLSDGKWSESLKPMPTARSSLSVFSNESAIVACGGDVPDTREDLKFRPLATVEVYSNTTLQWYTADPLPQPSTKMCATVIDGCGYIMGGVDHSDEPIKSVFSVELVIVIDRATSHTQDPNTTSAWSTLPDAQLMKTSACCLNGTLITVGGLFDEATAQRSVYAFVDLPCVHSWVKMPFGDLPIDLYGCTAVALPGNQVLVLGGRDDDDEYEECIANCYIGYVTV